MPGNAMLLIPPKNVSNAKHPYLIGVGLNCFTPSSHITTVRKYGWDGEFVGDFEIGTSNSKNPSSVCLRGNEHPIYDVLVSSTRLFKNFWTWKTLEHEKASVTLYWDDSSGGGVITTVRPATFSPVSLPAVTHADKDGPPIFQNLK
ncbi:para-aminobenzoate synthase, (PABA) [Marasmius tenuissimus]|uniref:Para-aminobenzoate synthase, (PABA) n=1 Tax=Marasmius tenuissimus TaxID=585030 RepID=A0ABR3A5K7_9AGAR